MPDPKIEHDLAELLDDQWWRLNNLYWIQGLDENENLIKMKFIPNDVQEKYYFDAWWRNVILKSRQHGMSTEIAILQLDQCLFNPQQTCGIIDKSDDDCKKKLAKQKYAYDHLDDPDDPITAQLGAAVKEAVKLVPPCNEHNLTFSNESKIWAATNHRGGTFAYLWISELGFTSYYFPKKASEIKTGALNTVHKGSKVVIESTHEGGKAGLNYDMIRLAQSSPDADNMTHLDWQFHFFGWHEDPKCSLELPKGQKLELTDEQKEYFDELLVNEGLDLSEEQKHWYIKKELEQKDDMKKEYPSTTEEAINAVVKGAIYGKEISKMRKEKRIKDFAMDSAYPLMSFWDLGQTDYTCMGLLQFTGRDFSVLDNFAHHGEDYRFYMAKLEEWERKWGLISADFIPHDGKQHSGPNPESWEECFKKGKRNNVILVPRTPDIWIGIRHLRGLLSRMWIHKTNCSKEFLIGQNMSAERIPSLIDSLEAYHTKPTVTEARIQELPVHDNHSHNCSMLRTFAEAHARGLLIGNTELERNSRRGGRGVRVIHDKVDARKAKHSGARRQPRILS